jgi:hypothetical protein
MARPAPAAHSQNMEHHSEPCYPVHESAVLPLFITPDPCYGPASTNDISKSRRKYPRFPTDEPAVLRVLQPAVSERASVRVVDVSNEGLGLTVERELDLGVMIQVLMNGLIALGQVRYCRPSGPFFHAGVQLTDVCTVAERRGSGTPGLEVPC